MPLDKLRSTARTFASLNFVEVSIECWPVPHPAINISGASTFTLSYITRRLILSIHFEIDCGVVAIGLTHLGYGLSSYCSLTFEETLSFISPSMGILNLISASLCGSYT